jgi:O-antigen/teichoic acid export membrane protein
LFEVSLILGGWLALSLVLAAPLAIDIVGGPEFDPAATVLRIQGLAMLASFVAALWGYALVGLRKHRELVVMSAVPLVVNTVLAGVLAAAYGARGAAVSTLVGEVTMALLGGVLLARAAGFTPVTLPSFPRVAVAGAAACALWLVPGLPILALVVLASLIYFAVLLVLRGIPKELLVELRGLRPTVTR